MKKNIELLMAKQFAELTVVNLDAVMKDDSLTDKEYNNIRDAHDSIASARDTIVRLTKPQRMVSAEAKENGYGESEDEEIVKLADEYYDKVLIKECDMEEKEAHHCRMSYIHGAKAMLEKQGQKSAWSEEDEGFLNLLLAIFTNEHPNGVFSTDGITVFKGNCVTSNRIITWLKSLKPQKQWKPSDEQIIELRRVISGCSYDIEPLAEMEEQLKKLREE